MADYNAIKGRLVQTLSSDPTLTSSYEGQVWYNSTEGVLKGLAHIKATSSGGTLPTTFYYPGGVGTTTATLAISGVGPSPIPAHTVCADYNGSSWTAAASIPVGSRAGYDFGTATAAVYAGGDYQSPGASPTITLRTAEYDGSSWSTTNNISEQGSFGAATGTSTAGLAFGGYNAAQTASSARTVSYDGTDWTALPTPGSDTNTARNFTRGGGGPQTAAIFSGGSPPNAGETEAWDGSSWTTQNSMNTGRNGSGFNGTQTLGVYIGGTNPGGRTSAIEEWDGTSWTTSSASLATARNGTINSKGGTMTNSLVAGGYTGTAYPTTTEEYHSNISVFSASQAAVWTSGGNLGAGRYQMNGQNVGTKDAGLCIGGQGSFPSTAPAVTVSSVEEYDGSSWSEVNNTPTTLAMTGSVGVQTAALQFGGYGKPGSGPNPGPSSPNFSASNHYDGTNWTSGGSLPASVAYLTGAGTQTAAVSIGGYNASTTCNLYNGSTWTATGSMTTGRHNGSAVGISTAALIIGGAPVPGGVANDVEEFNGSTWSSSPDLPTNREQASVGGTTASAYAGHGNQPGTNVLTLDWNGTAWSSGVNASTYRYGGVSGGTSTTGGYFAGGGGSASGTQRQSTEEYSFPAVAAPTGIASSTLTTS